MQFMHFCYIYQSRRVCLKFIILFGFRLLCWFQSSNSFQGLLKVLNTMKILITFYKGNCYCFNLLGFLRQNVKTHPEHLFTAFVLDIEKNRKPGLLFFL